MALQAEEAAHPGSLGLVAARFALSLALGVLVRSLAELLQNLPVGTGNAALALGGVAVCACQTEPGVSLDPTPAVLLGFFVLFWGVSECTGLFRQ